MSDIGYNGYYLHKTGERVNELLERDYIVPTLEETPTENTLTWKDGKYTHSFSIGDFVRVIIDSKIKFYRLIDVVSNKAFWKEVILEHQDITGKQDVLVSGINIKTINGNSLLGSGNITISGGNTGGGGSEVIILTQIEYDTLVAEGSIKETSIYFIKDDITPIALYIGSILIAQKDELGNISFPYNFPIIF